MDNEKVFAMSVGRVFPLLIAKAEKKGRTRAEVYAAISWLTGYGAGEIAAHMARGTAYRDFFEGAPRINLAAAKVTGSICGVKIQEIGDPLMKNIRILDKLVDELAKGKALERVLRA